MSQVLQKERTESRPTVRHRRPVVDRTLIGAGALVALFGVYLQFGPSDWWLGDLSEVYHFGCYFLSALVLMTGFSVYADRAWSEDGRWATRSTVGITLAMAAFVSAIVLAFELV